MNNPQQKHMSWHLVLRFADLIERPVLWIGRTAAWLILPMIGFILFDAISRKFLRKIPYIIENELYHLMNSPIIQDAEWHMHAIIFLGTIGYAYAHNAHVRLDIFRPRFGTKSRLWIEIICGIFLLIPFLCILIFHAWDFFSTSWAMDEASGSSTGIDNRWFIKFFIVLGPVLFLLSAVSIITRLIVRLFGPVSLHEKTRTDKFVSDGHSAFE